MHQYNEKLKVIVITEDNKQNQKYFNLFKVLFNNSIEEVRDFNYEKRITINNSEFRFIIKSESARGLKAHYVLNLTQDEEFHRNRAMPMTSPHSSLKEIEKWSELFTKL